MSKIGLPEFVKNYFYMGDKQSDNRKLMKRIFMITWPAFLELFLSSLFNMVDLVMVGGIGSASISGVGITNQPLNLLLSVFQAVNVGATTMVSWSIGEGNPKRASHIIRQTIILNAVMGVGISAAGVFGSGLLMGLITSEEAIREYATTYLTIISYSLGFAGVTMGISACLRGSGNTRIPMVYNIFANLLNVFGNYVLINGKLGFPQMGVAGAALSTSISRGVSCAMALYVVFLWKKSPIRLAIKASYKPDFSVIKRFFSIGLPAAGEHFVISTGLMVFSRIVTSLGVNSSDAHQIIANINMMAFSVSQSFSVSTNALVGQAVGANDFDLAVKILNIGKKLARFSSLIIATVFIIFARFIVGLYTNVPEVIDIASSLFIFIAGIQFVQSSNMCTAGALRGSGDTLFPLCSAVVGIWIFRVALAAFFVYVLQLGLFGAWLAFFLDQTARNSIVTLRWRSGKWKDKKRLKDEKLQQLKEKYAK